MTPLDALKIINHINESGTLVIAEGESIVLPVGFNVLADSHNSSTGFSVAKRVGKRIIESTSLSLATVPGPPQAASAD